MAGVSLFLMLSWQRSPHSLELSFVLSSSSVLGEGGRAFRAVQGGLLQRARGRDPCSLQGSLAWGLCWLPLSSPLLQTEPCLAVFPSLLPPDSPGRGGFPGELAALGH